MKRLSLIILIFSIAFALFFFGPPLLSKQFGIYPLMKVGDFFDIFTPLILMPLYWLLFRLLFRLDADKAPCLKEHLIFVIIAAFWVLGQGMHLSANSIGHLLKGTEGVDINKLVYFYDEILSHYLWHFGVVGLTALVIYRQWRNPFTKEQAVLWLLILAGIIHGFTLFVIVVEGGTTLLGVPFSVLVTLFGLIWGRKRFNNQPMLLFFFIACLVATLFFAIWGIYWHGFPEFSEVGIID